MHWVKAVFSAVCAVNFILCNLARRGRETVFGRLMILFWTGSHRCSESISAPGMYVLVQRVREGQVEVEGRVRDICGSSLPLRSAKSRPVTCNV